MLELEGKTALIFGVASEDSIAWAICQHLAKAGCRLILGYQPRYRGRLFQLKEQLESIDAFSIIYEHEYACDQSVFLMGYYRKLY